ncbi:MAG: right-handed parallel beta-helix repeat-containing protein [Planctomycetaceae bacterium]|nr:right-handed parallel beta-helix repeat-containing protein [Planctomycetaceae bacterium]
MRETGIAWLASIFLGSLSIAVAMSGCRAESVPVESTHRQVEGAFHVHSGDRIQEALDAAAAEGIKQVVVHEGIYRPDSPGQALIWLNRQHDGIALTAQGDVTLRADNPEVADPNSESYPAIVNHVVYFGDGITPATIFRGFRITGSHAFVTRDESVSIQTETGLESLNKVEFFYTDGGGIKIFGRSYPTIEEVDVVGNYARPCGGGVSVEHRGFHQEFVTFRDCIFRENRCQLTGSGVDVLPESSARFFNCLFLNNVGNLGEDDVSPEGESYNAEHGSGALTVFPGSRVIVENCTFTGNWNGVDDKGMGNVYQNNIFWNNTRPGGLSPGERFEFDILSGVNVKGCWIAGRIPDLRETIDESRNVLKAPDPQFDSNFAPKSPTYEGVGYRPVGRFAQTLSEISKSDSSNRP